MCVQDTTWTTDYQLQIVDYIQLLLHIAGKPTFVCL